MRDQLAASFDAPAARYLAVRDQAAEAFLQLRQLDAQLQDAEREIDGARALTEAEATGGVVLRRAYPAQSRLSLLMMAEADEHGQHIGPVLASTYARLAHNRRARTAAAES